MWKQNKWKIIISSLIILLPMVLGLILWNQLPEQMTTHWGIDGTADRKSSAAVAVFALPLILLVLYWIGLFFSSLDKKNQTQNSKAFRIIFWIMPVLSLFCNGIIYATAFGMELRIIRLMPIFLGFLFMLIGNYMPKCKQNFTLGIKVKWCLENEENWNATHRFGGKVWVLGGLLILFTVFLPQNSMFIVLFVLLFVTAMMPMFYSYNYYRRQLKSGTYVKNSHLPKNLERSGKIVALIVLPLIFIIVAFMMFTGDVKLTYQESDFRVKATFWSPLTVDYVSIDSIEYREHFDKGSRINGVGSTKLLAGIFHNEEFGNYTLYSYTKCDSVVIVKAGTKIVAISGNDTQSTKEIYDTLLSKCQEASK